jgi:hypothetical protein
MMREDIRTAWTNRYRLTAERVHRTWQVTIANVQSHQETVITIVDDCAEEEAVGLAWHQFLSPKRDE